MDTIIGSCKECGHLLLSGDKHYTTCSKYSNFKIEKLKVLHKLFKELKQLISD